jgi:hypothetical protein
MTLAEWASIRALMASLSGALARNLRMAENECPHVGGVPVDSKQHLVPAIGVEHHTVLLQMDGRLLGDFQIDGA